MTDYSFVPGYPGIGYDILGTPYNPAGSEFGPNWLNLILKAGAATHWATLSANTTATVSDHGKAFKLASFALSLDPAADLMQGWRAIAIGPGTIDPQDGASVELVSGEWAMIGSDGTTTEILKVGIAAAGLDYDFRVADITGLYAYEGEAVGTNVLVDDYAIGRAAIVTLEATGSPSTWSDPIWITGESIVNSVNGEIGDVVIDADDISDALTTNKFATAAQLTKIDFVTVTQPVDLDALETKTDLISITQPVDLDAIESRRSGLPGLACRVVDTTGADPQTYVAGATVDGTVLDVGDVVLRATVGGDAEDGAYTAGESGSPSPLIARHTSFDAWDDFIGAYFSVSEGTTYADTLWRCPSNKGGTLGVTALVFSKASLIPSNNLSDVQTPATARTNLSAAGVVRIQTFTASGTYTPHAQMLYCIIECLGAGGGGGGITGVTTDSLGAGGGGAGGYSRKIASKATIGASKVITIGAAGAGGAAGNNTGATGGNTSVGALCIANGGAGGTYPISGIGGGGAGGTAGTGDVAGTGEVGHSMSQATNVLGIGGNGGSTIFGSGGKSSGAYNNAVAGGAGTGYGGGGAGAAARNSTATAAGGDGTAGLVVITEYCSE